MNKKNQKPQFGMSGAAARAATPRPAAGQGSDDGISTPAAEGVAAPRPFSAVELRRISSHITTQWFLPAEGNRLTLMEVDPWRVHAYWNVAETDLAAARSSLPAGGGDAALVLRFTDLSPGSADAAPPHERFDIEVQGARNNWYIGLWRDARHYSAELGLRAPDGTFVALARSNEVVTPRGGPSPNLDFRHLEVRAPRAAQAWQPAGGLDQSDILLRDLFPARLAPEDDYPLVVAEPSGVVVEEPPFPGLDNPPEDVGPAELPGAAAVEAPVPGDPFPAIEPAEIEPYRALAREAQAEALARVGTRLPPVAEEVVSAGGLALELRPQPLPLPSGPAVGSAAGTLGAEAVTDRRGPDEGHWPEGGGPPALSTWWPQIPLEGVLAGAVFSLGRGPALVEAHAEILVYGRTEPDSRLTLLGEPVPTDSDGRFAARLPLERGPELAALLGQLRSRYGAKDDA